MVAKAKDNQRPAFDGSTRTSTVASTQLIHNPAMTTAAIPQRACMRFLLNGTNDSTGSKGGR